MDNSVMENFFGIVKNEMFYGHEDEFETLDDLRKAIEEYIEWYNSKRISIKRNGMSPFEYRQHSILQLQYQIIMSNFVGSPQIDAVLYLFILPSEN